MIYSDRLTKLNYNTIKAYTNNKYKGDDDLLTNLHVLTSGLLGRTLALYSYTMTLFESFRQDVPTLTTKYTPTHLKSIANTFLMEKHILEPVSAA